MEEERRFDYALEKRLRALSPGLHQRFADAVFALRHNLSNYKLLFPEYTDHTILHSMSVIDFCNRLIGDQIGRLNADEIFVLLMGCYFHDTGMGISQRDYEEFSARIDFGDYFLTHSREDIPAIVRDFHHEYSGCFIRKYAEFFELPTEVHIWAIVQIARGHRRTDLWDEAEYPSVLEIPNGNTICLPYLSALIRLADEIDVAAERNPILLYDIEALTDAVQIAENKKLMAVKRLLIDEESFTLLVRDSDEEVLEMVKRMAVKMQRTLKECREVTSKRTPFEITQRHVFLEKENRERILEL